MTDTPSTALTQGFRLANLAVLPGWFLMIVAPKSRLTRWLLDSDLLFLVFGGVYTAMLGSALMDHPESAQGLTSPTLEAVSRFFSDGGPKAVFAGWVHYLAFDFFVGRAILQDAQRREIPHVLVIPALFLTLMAGPLGYLYYRLLVRVRGES